MHKTLVATLALTLAGAAAAANFEGVIHSRITMSGKSKEDVGGTVRMYISGPGSRVETEMRTPKGSMKMTVLHLKAKPKVTYLVNDEKKSYFEMEVPETQPSKEKPEQLTVKKLANERVAGYDCAHALLTDEEGDRTEVWATKAIGGAEAFWAAQAGEDESGGRKTLGMAKALQDAGIDGWPLKFRAWPKHGQEAVWEATRVERKAVPASLFSLAGYEKSEGGLGALGQMQLSPEQQQQLEEAMKQQREAMKKMSPEQRKQMEELMKSMGGGVK